MLDRRRLLLAGAAALGGCASATPVEPDAVADAEFRDALIQMGDRPRSERAMLLRRFDPRRLTPEGRILYDAVLPGAAADAALADFAWGQSGTPYPVTHRNGAYRRAAEMRTEDRPEDSVRDVAADTAAL